MKCDKYIGMDVHQATTVVVVLDAEGKLVALLGVKDLVIVDTPDALLIANRARSQEVGELVKKLEKQRRDELMQYPIAELRRP